MSSVYQHKTRQDTTKIMIKLLDTDCFQFFEKILPGIDTPEDEEVAMCLKSFRIVFSNNYDCPIQYNCEQLTVWKKTTN